MKYVHIALYSQLQAVFMRNSTGHWPFQSFPFIISCCGFERVRLHLDYVVPRLGHKDTCERVW